MRALSIRQPWASMIVAGIKNIENRSWGTMYTGELVIHASKTCTREDMEAGRRICAELGREFPGSLPAGGYIGVVDFTAVIWTDENNNVVTDHPKLYLDQMTGYIPGNIGFYLENPRPIPIIPKKGRLGLYYPESRDIDTIRAYLAA